MVSNNVVKRYARGMYLLLNDPALQVPSSKNILYVIFNHITLTEPLKSALLHISTIMVMQLVMSFVYIKSLFGMQIPFQN